MGFDPTDWSDPSGAALAMAIAVLAVALGLWQYAAGGGREHPVANPWWLLAPALAIAGGTLVRIALTSGIDSDESEHLHVAYVIGHGVMPYRDFDQNHAPFLWMLTAPLLKILPETPYVLYLFRALSLASFVGSVAVACSLARQLARRTDLVAPLCAFLALATAVNAEVYRFRPDPFMNLCALLSLYFLLRPGGNATRQAFWAGLLQGLALAFSPKLAHLALLAPLILWLHCRRECWRGLLAYAAGGMLAVAPVLVWLGWHGLLYDAYASIVGANLGSASRRLAQATPIDPEIISPYTTLLEPARLLRLAPVFLLTSIGAFMSLRPAADRRATAALLLAGLLLWLAVWALTPNSATYHIAGALVLGAVFGARALEELASHPRKWAPLAMGAVLSLCLASAPLRSGIGGWVNGHTYPLGRVAWLLDAVRSRGGGCLCLVPWHPIFIPTVSPVYVSNERNSRRWGDALDWAAEHRPAVVMSRRYYLMAERGMVTRAQADRITKVLSENYRLRSEGSAGFWLLDTRPRS